MCAAHWSELREAIEVRALSPFVNQSGEAAATEIVSGASGTRDKSRPYDPLLSANMSIWAHAVHCGGLYLLHGELCPLCEMEQNTIGKAADWINPCCDEILADFRTKGWLPAAS